jgi:hypothetical protein
MQGTVNEQTGEVTLRFRPEEIRLAIFEAEHIAFMLENSGFKTEKVWEFALQLRGLNADRNGAPFYCDINGE